MFDFIGRGVVYVVGMGISLLPTFFILALVGASPLVCAVGGITAAFTGAGGYAISRHAVKESESE